MNTAAGGNGGWSGYGQEKNNEPATDWSQFLPGHAKDPTRSLAGGNAQNLQIQPKEVNIWNRISDRLKARCSQGLLRDCVP